MLCYVICYDTGRCTRHLRPADRARLQEVCESSRPREQWRCTERPTAANNSNDTRAEPSPIAVHLTRRQPLAYITLGACLAHDNSGTNFHHRAARISVRQCSRRETVRICLLTTISQGPDLQDILRFIISISQVYRKIDVRQRLAT